MEHRAKGYTTTETPVIDGDGHWMSRFRSSLIPRRSGRREISRSIRACGAEGRLVSGHTQSVTRADFVAPSGGCDEQYLRQGDSAATLLAERTPARIGHRLRADLSSFGLTINGITQDDLHRARSVPIT